MTKQPTNPDGSMIAVADSRQQKARPAIGVATVPIRAVAKVTVAEEVPRLPGTATNMDVLNPMTKMTIRKRMKGARKDGAAAMAAASGPPTVAGGRRPEVAPVALKTEAEIGV
jgi:hypothetical protein